MKLIIDKNTFDSMPLNSLAHACFEPMVPVYQAGTRGQSEEVVAAFRKEFYQSLPEGQRSLFLFFSYYDHAIRSVFEFEQITRHYVSAQIFGAVKKAADYFALSDMLHLLETVEQRLPQGGQNTAGELYQRLQDIAPATLEKIGAYIRENLVEFVQLAGV